jgi:tocopherol O-methyltransferase
VAWRVARGLVRDEAYRAYLFDRTRSERVFAASVPRLWLAYRVGALRYGLFVAEKPGDPRLSSET